MKRNIMNYGILVRIRKHRLFKAFAMCMAFNMIWPLLPWNFSYALTSGAAQPEASSFQQVSITEMVDPFSGDFSYNIPLLDVGGYPINLSYASGIDMDQEASWVGLGWNLNTGAITRNMRGLPDDFWGDTVKRQINLKDNITVGVNAGLGFEIFGLKTQDLGVNLSVGLDLGYNNYTGITFGSSVSPSIGIGNASKGKFTGSLGLKASGGALDIQPRVGMSFSTEDIARANGVNSLNFGLNLNSRSGLQSFSLDAKRNFSKSGPSRFTTEENLGYNGLSQNMFGANISFGTPSYTPQIDIPMRNYSLSFSGKFGIAIYGNDADLTVGAYFSKQSVAYNTIKTPGYGYMFSQKATGKSVALHDFNREKDAGFTFQTPNLALTNYTYDVYQIQAQGIGGSFRPYRNNAGYVFDSENTSYNGSGGGGIEVSGTSTVDFGGDINVNFTGSTSGPWTDANLAEPYLRFNEWKYNSLKEPVYFKLLGEQKVDSDPTYFQKLQKEKPLAFSLNKTDHLNNKFRDASGATYAINQTIERQSREKRNTSIEYFTVEETKKLYPQSAKYIPAWAPDHHIAMIVVTTPEGARYVFGCPAYNTVQKEATFAVGTGLFGSGSAPVLNGTDPNLVQYTSTDASVNNTRGLDRRYDATTLPAFVYTWYLTEVLSPDYVDVTGDGPSQDDLGNYTYFEYGEKNPDNTYKPNVPRYRWRTPLQGSGGWAQYNEGLKSDPRDDMANLTYGEKQIWYLSNIRSKHQIAVFSLTDRDDGMGVSDEYGSVSGTVRQKRLSNIKLYPLTEYLLFGVGATPIKTVHFNYSYDLCQNVPNNTSGNRGKLTLKEVFFTYEFSARAKFSPYQFDYHESNPSENPDYNSRAIDRWGYYMPEWGTIPNHEYPYTDQNQSQQDENCSAWSLKEITLPSGGKINIAYESDDYGHVQDKEAARMFNVIGASDTLDGAKTDKLYSLFTNYEYLYFELETPVSHTVPRLTANEQMRKAYMRSDRLSDHDPEQLMYFRFFTNISNALEPNMQSEYVSGYTEIDDAGVAKTNPGNATDPYDLGWVKVRRVTMNDNGGALVHPISKAGWQFSRINTPSYAFNQPNPNDDGFMTIVKTLIGGDISEQMLNFFLGPNARMAGQGFCYKFDPDMSWIRLYDPDNKKLGGGHRVKEITINDNWDELTQNTETDFAYGQQYFYENEDGSSSGVANWEPVTGVDENIHRMPIFFDQQHFLVPDDRFYQEEPVGESFFPAPSVGYSRVKIQNLQHAGVTNNATGHIIHEFYTAKDFPVKTSRTGIYLERLKVAGISFLLGIPAFDYVTASQGFTVELNDMHGKPKAMWVYEEDVPEPISGTEYKYNLAGETVADGLSSRVDVIDRDGKKVSKEMGVDFDFVADFRQYNSETYGTNIQLNLATFLIGFFPALIPSLFPDINIEYTRFRSATTTKVINRSGILKETIAYDLGSKVSTENIAFDERTGQVLVTQVNNEFDDDRFAVNTPAHWVYDRMGFASDNWGYEFEAKPQNISSTQTGWDRSTGELFGAATAHLVPGDEIMSPYVTATGRGKLSSLFGAPAGHINRLWVSEDSNGDRYLIREDGTPFTETDTINTYYFKVVRSGRRNMPSVNIGSAEMLERPFDGSQNLDVVQSKKILNASAQEFREIWKIHDNRQAGAKQKYLIVNPDSGNFILPEIMSEVIQNRVLHGLSVTAGFSGDIFPYCGMNYLSNPAFCAANYTVSTSSGYSGFYGLLSGNSHMLIELRDYSNVLICRVRLIAFRNSSTFTNGMFDQVIDISPGAEMPYNLMDHSIYNINSIAGQMASHGDYLVTATLNDGRKFIFVARPETGSCGAVASTSYTYETAAECNVGVTDTINPYIYGMLGNWRPKISYTYLVDRNDDTTGANVNLRTDGYFDRFEDFFWLRPSSPGGFWEKISSTYINPQNWKWVTEITEYSPWGFELENKDALGNFSSALYGYKNTLPVMVAQNAMYREIAYEGFEDYYSSTQLFEECAIRHFQFFTAFLPYADEAHTGWNSFSIANNSSRSVIRQVSTYDSTRRHSPDVPMIVQSYDLLGGFSPREDFEGAYLLSFWVKRAGFFPYIFDYGTDLTPQVIMNSVNVLSASDITRGPVIDGWQQYSCTFDITPSYTGNIEFKFVNSTGVTYLLDDIRVHPFDATAKTFVYDARTLKFMAELDENNYATFYEYDEEGALIRVKKETERGIMTIQENRNKSYKSDLSY